MIESKNLTSLAKAVRVYFNGEYRKEHGGVGELVVFDPRGQCVGGMSLYFGSRVKTSSEAELLGMYRSIEMYREVDLT